MLLQEGTILISNEDFINLSNEQLNNISTYEKIDENSLI